MYWKLAVREAGGIAAYAPQGRFVLHRHHDEYGAHLDLRLEADGYAVGYRVGAQTLEDGAWATEKMPHPLAWLEQDGDAVREDAGTYAVLRSTAEAREIVLQGTAGMRVVCFEREAALDAASAREVALALREAGGAAGQAGQLVRDGAAARQRTVARLCALGRELDGAAFDEASWRQLTGGMTLADVEGHLQGFEARFDRKYPAGPVSRPEALDSAADEATLLELIRTM